MSDPEWAAFIRRNPDYQGEPIIDPASPRTAESRCWFCHRVVPVTALIAGYDTWDEQRLACLACNEIMSSPPPPDDERLRAAAQEIADREPIVLDGETGDEWCLYCDASYPKPKHETWCSWALLRVALRSHDPAPTSEEP